MTEPAGRIPELAANKEDSDRLKLLPYIAEDLPDAELEQLRRMLFAREIELLEKLARRQGEKHSERVSEVLAESFTMRAGKDNQLNLALEPVVDKIFKDSLNRRKNDFVNLLFPLIGPVIRKSIAESFLSMLGNFSQSLDVAFSWRGLKWRLEALRSGRPFNEIVLLHTVLYRVEQVFFIHSETGLALNHAVNEEITGKDADMVSGMLTAIQDFARDSFSGGSEDHLDSLKMGELLLIIEKREQAYLACVVRGTPPADLRKDLQETLDLMLVEYSVPLDEFSGDTAPFITAVRYLQPLLSSSYNREKKKISLLAKFITALVIAGIIIGAGYLWHQKTERTARLEKALASLTGQPGIMITNVIRHRNAPWEVLAFKDALALPPQDILLANGCEPGLLSIRTVPFISHDYKIVQRRVMEKLAPPKKVRLRLEQDGSLFLSGESSMAWGLQAKEKALSVPGVQRVDISGLHDPLTEQILALVKKINAASIKFPMGKDTPVPADIDKLEEAVDNLLLLEKIAKKAGLMVSLTVYGHADAIGTDKANYEISMARTRTVASRLYAKGSGIQVSMYGMGAEFDQESGQEEEKGSQASRRIELHVHLSRAVSVDNLFEENSE